MHMGEMKSQASFPSSLSDLDHQRSTGLLGSAPSASFSRQDAAPAGRRRQSLARGLFLWLTACSITLLLPLLPEPVYGLRSGLGPPDLIYTSSSAYCSPPEAVLIDALDFTFYKENKTLAFDISAASVQPGLELSVDLNVNAYGLGLFNLGIDLCDTVTALCPLPTYQFHGQGVFAVPEQFVNEIPSIAYSVPNLEITATVELTDSTGATIGCVQTTLSNGRSTYQVAAKWATVGLLILAGLSSLLHTSIARSLGAAQWRVVDVLMSMQHVVITALMSLQYPQVFIEFARNFAWSAGLIDIEAIQKSISSTRYKTGGYGDGTFGSLLTAQTGRRFSPFNVASSTPSSSSLGGLSFYRSMAVSEPARVASPARHMLKALSSNFVVENGALKRDVYAPNTGPGGRMAQSTSDTPLPLIERNGTTEAGLSYFAEKNYIAPNNAFLTVLVSFAMFLGIVLVASLVILLFALYVRFVTRGRAGRMATWSRRFTKPSEFFGSFLLAVLGRVILMTWTVYLIFAFYQWNHGDSWVPDMVAAIVLALYLAGILGYFLPMFLHSRRGSRDDLYFGETPPAVASPIAKRWGTMAHPFKPKYYWFYLVFLLCGFTQAGFVGFGQGGGHGLRQSIGCTTVDVLLLLVLCICRPGRDKTSNFVWIVLCIFRIISWGICIAFTTQAGVTTIPRVVVGFAQIVITGLPIIFLFFVTVWDLVSPFLRKGQRRAADGQYLETQDEMHETKSYAFGAIGTEAGASTGDTTLHPSGLSPTKEHKSSSVTTPSEARESNNGALYNAPPEQTRDRPEQPPQQISAGPQETEGHQGFAGVGAFGQGESRNEAQVASPSVPVRPKPVTADSGFSYYQDARSGRTTPMSLISGNESYHTPINGNREFFQPS